jgi:Zn-dependent peptidase ImmA (M78 family)
MDALDPWRLAELYGIRVEALNVLPLPNDVHAAHFTVVRPEAFSGALVSIRTAAVINENDTHPLARRRSTMGHEPAHVFGEHKFGTSLVNERGCRLADQAQEGEAAEIGGELLIPFEAAKRREEDKAVQH